MAEGKTYQSRLTITGNIDPKLFGDIKKLVGENAKIIKQAGDLGKESKKAFELMGKGVDAAKVKMVAFGEAVKGAILPLLGISVAFKGFTTIIDVVGQASEKFQRLQEQLAAFKATISSTGLAKSFGTETVEKYFAAQQKAASERFEGLIPTSIFREIESQMLKEGIKPGQQMVEAIAEYVAKHAGKPIKNLTPADFDAVSTTVALAMRSGNIRSLGADFGFARGDREAAKRFLAASIEEKERMIFQRGVLSPTSRFIENYFAQAKDRTEVGQTIRTEIELLRIRRQNMAEMLRLGAQWNDIQDRGEAVSLKIQGAFLPMLEYVGEELNKLFDNPEFEAGLKNVVDGITSAFKNIFDPASDDQVFKQGDIWGNLMIYFDIFRHWLIGQWAGLMWSLRRQWDEWVADIQRNDPKGAAAGILSIFRELQGVIQGTNEDWNIFTSSFTKAFSAAQTKRPVFDTITAESVGGAITGGVTTAAQAADEAFGTAFAQIADAIHSLNVTITSEDFQSALKSLGTILGQIAGEGWDALKSVVVDLSNAIQDLATQISRLLNVTGGVKTAGQAVNESAMDLMFPGWRLFFRPAETGRNIPPKEARPLALGGIIATPQVGLVGEAGRESIIPLRQDANTLGIMQATFDALGIRPGDPTSWGQELFPVPTLGGFGFGGGYIGGDHHTEYGPGVPGDQPGGPTYDWNSYHRVGAWPAITGPLRPGDVALGYAAQARYNVRPGDVFTDDKGNVVRFADRSGSKDPLNEDHFRLATGGIVTRRILSWIGEGKHPEAVLPLDAKTLAKHGLGGNGASEIHHHFSPNIIVNGGGPGIAEEILAVMQSHFSRFLEEAAFEFQRRALS